MEDGASSKEALIEQQLRYCSQVLTRLKRNSNAPPFLEPVDPVKLEIPDYPVKIKNPMDISTVRKKLDRKEYGGPEEFDADMKLMFKNCYIYNPEGTAVYEMGKGLESVYDEMMSGMPSEVAKRRKRTEGVERPKHVKRGTKTGETMKGEDYEVCSEILVELGKAKHKAYNWPFLEPVDGNLVPGYYSVIKEPMDLQTIRGKVEQREYRSVGEFVRDLRLIIENCKKFNAPGTDVYVCGQEFEKAVNGYLERMGVQDVPEKIAELKRKVAAYTKEIRMLETRVLEGGSSEAGMRTYSLSERIGLGNAILRMSRSQAEEVARIVQRHNVGTFVDNDEIEVDMRMIPDDVVEEIDMYVKKACGEAVSSQNE